MKLFYCMLKNSICTESYAHAYNLIHHQPWVFVFCCLVQSCCVKDYPFAQGTLVGEMDSSAWKGEQGLQDRKLTPDSYRVHLPVKGSIQLSGGGVMAPGHTVPSCPQVGWGWGWFLVPSWLRLELPLFPLGGWLRPPEICLWLFLLPGASILRKAQAINTRTAQLGHTVCNLTDITFLQICAAFLQKYFFPLTLSLESYLLSLSLGHLQNPVFINLTSQLLFCSPIFPENPKSELATHLVSSVSTGATCFFFFLLVDF